MLKFYKKNKLLFFMIIPALIIIIAFSIGFLKIFGDTKGKEIILLSLLIITPIIFFLNGVFSNKFKMNFILYSLPSYLSFSIVFFIWLNSSASIYYILYFASNFLGFSLYKIDKKIDQNKEKKIKQRKFYSKIKK